MSLYVYCLGEGLRAEWFGGVRGVCGAQVRVVALGGVAAVVSEFGGGTAQADAENLRAHNRVNAAALARATPLPFRFGTLAGERRLADYVSEKEGVLFAARAAVAPLRFGTIYLRGESVERMLEERGAQLRSVLGRLEGREEWGLNLFVERARLREGVAHVSPRLREMGERADASSPGQAYLLRKKIESLRDEEARAETRRVAAEVEGRLGAASDGAARLRVLKDEAAEQGELAARFAFLVARNRFNEFRAAAERLAEEYTPLGFRFELTGPWPAYNFVVFDEERETEVRG